MLNSPVTILSGSDESFTDRDDPNRQVQYVALTIMVAGEVLKCTGKTGVLAGLDEDQQSALKAGRPVEAWAAFELRPGDNMRTCRPRVVEFGPVAG